MTGQFGFSSTASEILADVDLRGRRVVITGATSGIGCAESPVVTQRPDDFRGVAQYALDPDNAARLWDLCAADMARL